MMFGFLFYGVMVILICFFLEDFNYSEVDIMMVVGVFLLIGFLFVIVGGFIVDKFFGVYCLLVIFYVMFVIGYVLLVLGVLFIYVFLSLVGIVLVSYVCGLMLFFYLSLYKCIFVSEEDFNNGYFVNYLVNNVGVFLG